MSRNRSPTVPPANQHTAVSVKTLRLFTVSSSDDAAAVEAEVAASVASSTSGRTTDSGSTVRSKNPLWLASREKEAQSEAIREKMLALVADIEAEEARERPAMKKAWLHDKKMELRKLSFKQPEGIIAGEAYFRKVRRKLRKARQGGGGSGDEDSGRNGEAGDEDEDDDDYEAASSSVVKSERRSTSMRKFRAGGRLNEGEEPSDDDNDDDASNADGAFHVNPEGRLARRNPRVETETAEDSRKAGWRGPMKKMSKVVRFPLDSGFKLGRMIRKHRDKQKIAKSKVNGGPANDDASDASDASGGGGGGGGGGEWGERVHTPEELLRQQLRRPSDQPSLSTEDSEGGPPVRLVVINNGDDEGATAVGGGSVSSGSVADIPVLQESVGRKIRDRLTIRRLRRKGGSGSSGGDASCHDDTDGDGKKKAKKKSKEPSSTKRKDKERKDAKPTAKRSAAGDACDDEKENGGTVRARSVGSSGPVQSIELEDA